MKLKSLLAVVALVVSANAQASSLDYELTVTPIGGLGGTSGAFTYNTSTPASWTLGLGGQVARNMGGGLQLDVKAALALANANNVSVTGWNAAIGATYNFDEKLTNSIYIDAFIGLSQLAQVGATSSFGWEAGVGKRFTVVPGVNFNPEVGVLNYSGTSTLTAYFQPVQFSFFL